MELFGFILIIYWGDWHSFFFFFWIKGDWHSLLLIEGKTDTHFFYTYKSLICIIIPLYIVLYALLIFLEEEKVNSFLLLSYNFPFIFIFYLWFPCSSTSFIFNVNMKKCYKMYSGIGHSMPISMYMLISGMGHIESQKCGNDLHRIEKKIERVYI